MQAIHRNTGQWLPPCCNYPIIIETTWKALSCRAKVRIKPDLSPSGGTAP